MQQFTVADGFVTYTKHSKYLGSYLSYNPRDNFDIDMRIELSSKSIGASSSFWNNPHGDMYSNFLPYKTNPTNLLLWGCKTWALCQGLLRKLDVILHKNKGRTLEMSMKQVAEDYLHNKTVR